MSQSIWMDSVMIYNKPIEPLTYTYRRIKYGFQLTYKRTATFLVDLKSTALFRDWTVWLMLFALHRHWNRRLASLAFRTLYFQHTHSIFSLSSRCEPRVSMPHLLRAKKTLHLLVQHQNKLNAVRSFYLSICVVRQNSVYLLLFFFSLNSCLVRLVCFFFSFPSTDFNHSHINWAM